MDNQETLAKFGTEQRQTGHKNTTKRPVLVVEEAEYPERTMDHGQATGKLDHLRLRVECTLFRN
jgi:hypothetical protein